MVLFEPRSSWAAPRSFPDLSGERILGVDLEVNDPYLLTQGPGGIRGAGHVAGISVATKDRGWYFPIQHQGGGNMDRDAVVRYVRDLCARDRWYVGANIGYDIEWLDTLGIRLGGRILDVQVIDALIDEEQDRYTLEAVARRNLDEGKDETLLKEAAAVYGVDPKSGMWRLPAKFVGPYAEKDAHLCVRILERQMVEVRRQELERILELECKLTPLMYAMRKQGIPIDLDAAAKLSGDLGQQEQALRAQFKKDFSRNIDEWSGQQIAGLCDELKISYPHTDKGNPSFESEWLEAQEHPLFQAIIALRAVNRLKEVFVDKWVFENVHNGRVHPNWHQLRGEDGGTRTGRMAASRPNPQQVPSRSSLAALIRRMFVPEEGMRWAKYDYSQQEPRILVHYASKCKLTAAQLVVDAYNKNRDMDIYQFMADAAHVSRRDSKTLTLGRMYGMGSRSLAGKLGISEDEAKKLFREFDESVPFVKELADLCSNRAQSRGYIITLGGRRRHFNLYEPCWGEDAQWARPMRHELAKQRWPKARLRRAYAHKALNSLIQGSAADMTKAAIVAVHEEHGMVPYMAVHDELNYGVQFPQQGAHLLKLIENALPLVVPCKAELHIGDHWK